jgi:esterase/lipase superfamily enzyme
MKDPTNLYMITNRSYDSGTFGTTVGDQLYLLMAPVSDPTNFAITSQSDWLSAIAADLKGLSSEGRDRWATLFVHGFGVSFEKATTEVFPTYFTNIESKQPSAYPGVFIGFDWPSDVEFKTALANASQTGQQSFPQLLPLLQTIVAFPDFPQVALNLICHSMGNYVMWEGATAFPSGRNPIFKQILLVAAMLDSTAFNSPTSATPCADICNVTQRVTVYYSSHDDVLPLAQDILGYPQLGITGPTYDSTLLPKVIGLDCSNVVDKANAEKYNSPKIHTSYFYIPEVLEDIALTSRQRPANDIWWRAAISGTSFGFTMEPWQSATDGKSSRRATTESAQAGSD